VIALQPWAGYTNALMNLRAEKLKTGHTNNETFMFFNYHKHIRAFLRMPMLLRV
jgi:hypothetical protein